LGAVPGVLTKSFGLLPPTSNAWIICRRTLEKN